VILLNLAMAAGLVAAATPVVVHLLHRHRARVVDWGAMRFLMMLLRRSRRRLLLEQFLLLAVRTALLASLALALTRPALEGDGDTVDRIVRHGRTAAVLLLDDSLSSAAGRARPRLEAVKAMAHAYLDTLRQGDEVSVLPRSRLGEPCGEPLLDLAAAHALIDALAPTALASDVPRHLEEGLAQAAHHLNPNLELVLIDDAGAEGWALADRARWRELRQRLRPDEAARSGTRLRPRLLLLAPAPAAEPPVDLAVTAITCDRSLVPVQRPVTVRCTVAHRGPAPLAGARLRLLVDGRSVGEQVLAVPVGGRQELAFRHVFREAGSHAIEAVIDGARDALAASDHRALAVVATADLPVLLIEGRAGPGVQGALGFAAMALAPDPEPGGLFAVRRIGVGDLGAIRLEDFRVVLLGDCGALEAATVAALERYVVGGGGLVVSFGPLTEVDLVNRFWARGGDGVLPCPLRTVRDLDPALPPGSLLAGHPALAAFTGTAHAAWQQAQVRRMVRFDTDAVEDRDLAVLLRLSDGEPLVVERIRGLGTAMAIATSLDLSWSDLAVQPAFVPLLRGLVAQAGNRLLPPRNLMPGQSLAHPVAVADTQPRAEDPAGQELPLSAGAWHGREVVASAPLATTGIFRVHEGATVAHYAVAADPGEFRLEELEEAGREQALGGLDPHGLRGAEAVARALGGADRQGAELWPWLVLSTLGLLVAETLLCRRQSRRERAAHGQEG
jgi:hypothetical protein